MKIIIIGGGSIGFITAKYFAREEHDVTIIEEKSGPVHRIQNKLDVNVVEGSGTNINSLKAAGIEKAELFLALTDNDEVNIISCTLAKQAGVSKKIARINHGLLSNGNLSNLCELGVDEIINTEENVVERIKLLIKYPGVSNLKYFFDNSFVIGIFSFKKTSPYYGANLAKIKFCDSTTVLGHIKENTFHAYDEKAIIDEYLSLCLVCRTEDFDKTYNALMPDQRPIKNILIYGTGYKSDKTTISLIESLQKDNDYSIIISLDREEQARRISSMIDAQIILSDPAKPDFRQLNELKKADCFIAMGNMCEKNVFASVLSNNEGVSQTIAMVRFPEHTYLNSKLPFTNFINPAMITADQILKYHKLENIISRTILIYEKIECVKLILSQSAKASGKKIIDLKFNSSKIVTIKRDQDFLQVGPQTQLKPGDHIFLFLTEEERNKLKLLI